MKSSDPQAVILIGHGSRVPGFDFAMRMAAKSLQKDKQFSQVVCAFLEIASPSISEAIDAAVSRGAKRIHLVPYFVHTGRHVLEDIPKIAGQARKKHEKKTKIHLCSYLGYDQKIVDVIKKRIQSGR